MPANDSDILFLNIYLRTEAMFRQAARRTLETNPLLQPFISASDLKRRTSERVISHINQIRQFSELELNLLVIDNLKRLIIDLYGDCQLLEGMDAQTTEGFDRAAPESDNVRKDGAPQSADEWIGFHNSFETLPPVQRSVMELRYYAGLNIKDISRLTGQPKHLVNALILDGMDCLQNLIFEKRRAKAPAQSEREFASPYEEG